MTAGPNEGCADGAPRPACPYLAGLSVRSKNSHIAGSFHGTACSMPSFMTTV